MSGIMALFSITLISVFMASFRGGTKSQLIQRIRQDGDYVLSTMSREIKRTVEVESCGTELQLKLVDGSPIRYRVASDSSFLTGTVGKAEDLIFSCEMGQTGHQIVTISFSLTSGGPESQAQEKISQGFATSISTREH